MGGLHHLLNNFTGGEVTPQLDARLDLQKYATSCRTLENFRPLPYGGVTYRCGSVYVQPTKGNGIARMVNFDLSTTVRYKLEFGAGYIRFFRNKANLGPNYEVVTPYTIADLSLLQFFQINSVMYIVHPSYPVQKLLNFSDTNWSIGEVPWTYPALLDQNISAITITPSALTGAINLVASTAIFDPLHVGAYFELAYKRDASNVQLAINTSSGITSSSVIQVKGDWTIVTTQYWYGTLQVERSIDGTAAAAGGWEIIRQFVSQSSRNVNGSGTELTNNFLRITYSATGNPFGSPPWSGTAPTTYVAALAVLETSQVFVTGLVKVTGYTDSTHVAATVVGPALPLSTATMYWSEGAWSPYRGYPSVIGSFEQRILYAGTTYRPTTVWGSATGDFDNIQYSDSDDAALAFLMANCQQNRACWLASGKRVHIGTEGEEMEMASGNDTEALSPNNVTVRRESSYGSQQSACLQIDSGILFIQRQGRRIRELSEVEQYGPNQKTSPDLTLLAEHITLGGISQLAFARLPDPLIHCVRGDGQLPVLTYNKEQNILAWARYITNGTYESVCAGFGDPSDEVWVIVKRYTQDANGIQTVVRYIEVFEAEQAVPDLVNGVYLDSCKKFSKPNTFLLNVPHLTGRVVTCVADGVEYANLPVSQAGQITIPAPPGAGFPVTVRVGMAYTGTLLPMKIDALLANGTSQGRVRNINEFTARFLASIGGTFGYTLSNMEQIPWRDANALMGATPPLYTGDVTLPWNGINDGYADMYVQQTHPFPFTLLALIPELKVMT